MYIAVFYFDWNENAINGKRRDKSYGLDIIDRKLPYEKEQAVLRLIAKVVETRNSYGVYYSRLQF